MPEYRNPVPVAVALIPLVDGSLLGIVRGKDPGRGGTALPGGFVDEFESFEMAVVRETLEECALVTTESDWELVCSRVTDKNRVLVFLRLRRALSHEEVAQLPFAANEEVLALVRIDASTTLCFPTHRDVTARYFAQVR